MCRTLVLLLLFSLFGFAAAAAYDGKGMDETLFAESVPLPSDSACINRWRFNGDALLFFRNNEFSTPLMKGYTLPGFRIRPNVSFRPNSFVNIQAGVYALKFWGTDKYPNMAYRDIAKWTGNTSRGFHLLPFLRASMTTRFGLTVVLGSLYGGTYHALPEPLYAPELNLTADPEMGAQLIFRNSRIFADVWINWESFIYRGDTHQEAFVFGLSSKVNLTRPSSPWRIYLPVSLLFQHRGGEIDDTDLGVQTLMNASAGAGVGHDFNRKFLRNAALELQYLHFNQMDGTMWPFKSGFACYANAFADIDRVRVKLGYLYAKKFISLFGYPLFGNYSTTASAEVFGSMSTLMLGADYHYSFAKGYTLGVDLSVWHQPKAVGWSIPAGEFNPHSSSTSISFGVYMLLSPSFRL